MAHRHLAALAAEGFVVRQGAGRAASYRHAGALPFTVRFPRAGATEDRVWEDLVARCQAIGALRGSARSLFQYACTELLNNAIEHSAANEVEVRVRAADIGTLAVEIIDDGIGLFANLRRMLGFKSNLEALQELSKGKLTTLSAGHTGEGIFFTSKAARRFEVDSGGTRWLIDNGIGDTAFGEAPVRKGTRVRFEGSLRPRKTLTQVFAEHTDDLAFTKTRIVVKLFAIGIRFISRSEARRLVTRLDQFRTVVLDFQGVEDVGQGFADEVFRVWARLHQGVRLEAIRMAPAVKFMVDRARRH
jgi:hypothetical protein